MIAPAPQRNRGSYPSARRKAARRLFSEVYHEAIQVEALFFEN